MIILGFPYYKQNDKEIKKNSSSKHQLNENCYKRNNPWSILSRFLVKSCQRTEIKINIIVKPRT